MGFGGLQNVQGGFAIIFKYIFVVPYTPEARLVVSWLKKNNSPWGGIWLWGLIMNAPQFANGLEILFNGDVCEL